MGGRKKQSQTSHAQLARHAEDDLGPSNTATSTHESFIVDKETFFLTDDVPGDAGWSHICERHLNGRDVSPHQAFPQGTTESDVKELIRKTITNGKWYSDTRSTENERWSDKESRVYLWDSRSDEGARQKGIYQMCVVTTNETSKQHSIITAYPRYTATGENTDGSNAILNSGSVVNDITTTLAQRTVAILQNLKQIDQNIIAHKRDQQMGDQQFLADLSKTHATLSTELETAKEQLNTARNEYTNFRLQSQDPKLNKLLGNSINSATKTVGDASRSVDNVQKSIDDGHNQQTADIGEKAGPSQPEPETPRPQETDQNKNIETSENIQKINNNLNSISNILDSWGKKRSKTIVDATDVPFIYGPESHYTHHEYRDKLRESRANITKLTNENSKVSEDINKLTSEINDINDTHPKLQNIERRVQNDQQNSDHTIKQGLELVDKELHKVEEKISAYKNTGKDPAKGVAQSEQKIKEISKDTSRQKDCVNDGWNKITNVANKSRLLTPSRTPKRSSRPATLESVRDESLSLIRSVPQGKAFLSVVYAGNNDMRAETDAKTRDAENKLSELIKESRHMRDGKAARSHMQTGKSEFEAIKRNKSELDSIVSNMNAGIKHVFPDIDRVNLHDSMRTGLMHINR